MGKPDTKTTARNLLRYYTGGRRLFGYGRWQAVKWAVQMALKDLRGG